MLPRTHRLRDKGIIDQVFKTGTLQKTQFFNIWKKNMTPPPQLLVMISTRVSKKANERNRLRRRTHEAFRELLPGIPPSLKAVVVVDRAALEAHYTDLKNAIAGVISK